MSTRAAWLSLILASFAFLFPASAPAQEAGLRTRDGPTVVYSSGTARVYRTPDYVDIGVGVVAQEPTASAAQASANAIMEKAIAAIKGLKLDGSELQTGSVNLNARYEERNYNPNEIPKIIGYRAEITMRIRTTDLKSVARVIDAGLAAGLNQVEYVQFAIKDALEAREEAIKLASKAAKRKAGVLADSLDLKLGRVLSANSQAQQTGWWRGSNYTSNLAVQTSGAAPRGGDAESPVVPGSIEVVVDVSLEFEAK